MSADSMDGFGAGAREQVNPARLDRAQQRLVVRALPAIEKFAGALARELRIRDREEVQAIAKLALADAGCRVHPDQGVGLGWFILFAKPRVRGAILHALQAEKRHVAFRKHAVLPCGEPGSRESERARAGKPVPSGARRVEQGVLAAMDWQASSSGREETEAHVERAEWRRLLASAAAELPEREASIVRAWIEEDRSVPEVAAMVERSKKRRRPHTQSTRGRARCGPDGLAVQTVRDHLNRALKSLRRALARGGVHARDAFGGAAALGLRGPRALFLTPSGEV